MATGRTIPAGIARMFGAPLPSVPEAWRNGSQECLESLKQESSVEAFGVVHGQVLDGGEKKQTVRDRSLIQLKAFFESHAETAPEVKEWAGLRRIGGDDGTAVWTALLDGDIQAAIERRGVERRSEEQREKEENRRLKEELERLRNGQGTSSAGPPPEAPASASATVEQLGGGTTAAGDGAAEVMQMLQQMQQEMQQQAAHAAHAASQQAEMKAQLDKLMRGLSDDAASESGRSSGGRLSQRSSHSSGGQTPRGSALEANPLGSVPKSKKSKGMKAGS